MLRNSPGFIPTTQRWVVLNEVLSLNAQELRSRVGSLVIGVLLNEVLSLNAQE